MRLVGSTNESAASVCGFEKGLSELHDVVIEGACKTLAQISGSLSSVKKPR